MKNLILFVGFQASGKNTAAEALYPYGFVPLSFADALKDMLASIFCWDRQMLEGMTSTSREWREKVDPWWAARLGISHFTPRWAMQNIGTDIMRRHLHEDIWVFNTERRMMMLGEQASVVLIDGRFPNEIALARRHNGHVERIKRGDDPWWSASLVDRSHYAHESEWAWMQSDIDGTTENDGSISQLHAKIIDKFTLGLGSIAEPTCQYIPDPP